MIYPLNLADLGDMLCVATVGDKAWDGQPTHNAHFFLGAPVLLVRGNAFPDYAHHILLSLSLLPLTAKDLPKKM